MKNDHTNLILIISIFVMIFSFSTFIFFFKVVENKNEHTSKVLSTLGERITDRQNSKALIDKSVELESIKETINQSFVDQSRIDTFVDYLENLGSNNDLELTVKNIDISSKDKNTLIIKISTRGEFANIMKVLYILENIPYNISISQSFINKEIKTAEDKDGENEETGKSFWQADISFRILTL